MNCKDEVLTIQKEDVNLRIGTIIAKTGDMKMKDGRLVKIENNSCVTTEGIISNCAEMHSNKNKKDREKVDSINIKELKIN